MTKQFDIAISQWIRLHIYWSSFIRYVIKKSFTFAYLRYNNYYIRSYIKKSHCSLLNLHAVWLFGSLCEACNAFEILDFVCVARNRKQIPEDQCISLFPSAKSSSKENITLDKTPQNNRGRCERRNLPFSRSTRHQSKMDLDEEFPPLGVPRYVRYITLLYPQRAAFFLWYIMIIYQINERSFGQITYSLFDGLRGFAPVALAKTNSLQALLKSYVKLSSSVKPSNKANLLIHTTMVIFESEYSKTS